MITRWSFLLPILEEGEPFEASKRSRRVVASGQNWRSFEQERNLVLSLFFASFLLDLFA